jgi:hypothetical protein
LRKTSNLSKIMDTTLEEICGQLHTSNRLVVIRLCIDDAIASAVRVLDVFETDYLEDERPRKAIEAAKAVGNTIDQFLAGQATAQDIERLTEALWQAADAVSEETLYSAKKWPAWLVADAVCHTAHTAGEVTTGRVVGAVNSAACAASSAGVSRWLAEIGEQVSRAEEWQKSDAIYWAKREELRQIAVEILMKQDADLS